MATFKQKVEHLSSMKKIINEELQRQKSPFNIGFTFTHQGTKTLYKTELPNHNVVANLGNFLTFAEMSNYLNGFWNALRFLDYKNLDNTFDNKDIRESYTNC